ncbi:Set1/Ash2 histone methyltransferase complex subunit ASH2 [Blastocladiella emersonii ATCC 22665]|nr:Set1/Ash2 histone methyltransferase complex subunit ASH2 [Blastocladiella emersonii ATCC 22665]
MNSRTPPATAGAKPRPFVLAYQDLDNVDAPTSLCRDTTHSSQKIAIAADGVTVRGDKGYRQVKANHGVTEGRWYFEVTVSAMAANDNARIGWATIAADLQAPCGFDVFSYGFRASPGTLFHDSRPVTPPTVPPPGLAAAPAHDGMDVDGASAPPHPLAQGYREGDVLGVMIYLPPPTPEQQVLLNERRWIPPTTYKQIKLPLPLPKLGPKSEIRYFRNGVDLGPAFTDLNLGKYYPAVSLFRDAEVVVNMGPKFKFPPLSLITEAELPIIPLPPAVTLAAALAAQAAAAAGAPPPVDEDGVPRPAKLPPPEELAALEAAEVSNKQRRLWAFDTMHNYSRCFPASRVRDLAPCIPVIPVASAGEPGADGAGVPYATVSPVRPTSASTSSLVLLSPGLRPSPVRIAPAAPLGPILSPR